MGSSGSLAHGLQVGIPERIRLVPDLNRLTSPEFFPRILARITSWVKRRLNGNTSIDPEDISIPALNSFINAVERNDYPSDDDLWPILITITRRKLAKCMRRQRRKRRDVARTDGSTDMSTIEDRSAAPAEQAIARELLEGLDDDELKTITLLRLARYTNKDVADQLGCSERTIDRKLEIIRKKLLEIYK